MTVRNLDELFEALEVGTFAERTRAQAEHFRLSSDQWAEVDENISDNLYRVHAILNRVAKAVDERDTIRQSKLTKEAKS